MNKKRLIESYKTPYMEVVEVEAENGFTVSGNTEGFGDYQ